LITTLTFRDLSFSKTGNNWLRRFVVTNGHSMMTSLLQRLRSFRNEG